MVGDDVVADGGSGQVGDQSSGQAGQGSISDQHGSGAQGSTEEETRSTPGATSSDRPNAAEVQAGSDTDPETGISSKDLEKTTVVKNIQAQQGILESKIESQGEALRRQLDDVTAAIAKLSSVLEPRVSVVEGSNPPGISRAFTRDRNVNTSDLTSATKVLGKVILDEKYFRRIPIFNGGQSEYRPWMFQLLTAIGQVDRELLKEIKALLKRYKGPDPSKWKPSSDPDMNQAIHDQFKQELYGVLVSLTSGEPLGIVKGTGEDDEFELENDGFKAILLLSRR